jgi:hypothetical protein
VGEQERQEAEPRHLGRRASDRVFDLEAMIDRSLELDALSTEAREATP